MTAGVPEPVKPPVAVDDTNAFVRMTGSGDPEQHIVLGKGARPTAGRGNVVVRVEAAGVSYAEV
ncbi:hypothetical protein NGM37_20665, partial [Streptomyces sp. TRM76130]|nr:hypothetical protein [Streptomyces sp. TRM76130]